MENYYILEISGKNPKQFLKYLYRNKINIWNIKYQKDNILIQVSYIDYLNIMKIKTTYSIKVINIKGSKKIGWVFNQYKLFFIFFLVSIVAIICLSNIIFKINFVDMDNDLEKIIKQELIEQNITPYSFKKSYSELNSIKNSIKAKYNNQIEWIEIENMGVTYNIRAIKRIINTKEIDNTPSNIVAAKDGILLSIIATSGEVLKNPGDYVKKGDVVVSGIIKNKEEIVEIKKAIANIYAEVWYKVTVKHPISFIEEMRTDEYKTFYYFDILGTRLPNNINNRYKLISKKNLIMSKSFKLIQEKRNLVENRVVKYNDQELEKLMINKAYNKINNSLKDDEEILLQKTLKKNTENDRMIIEVFYKVKENITKSEAIDLSINEEKYD